MSALLMTLAQAQGAWLTIHMIRVVLLPAPR
jgi:hypothetical protein